MDFIRVPTSVPAAGGLALETRGVTKTNPLKNRSRVVAHLVWAGPLGCRQVGWQSDVLKIADKMPGLAGIFTCFRSGDDPVVSHINNIRGLLDLRKRDLFK